jgi:hypothetical protein
MRNRPLTLLIGILLLCTFAVPHPASAWSPNSLVASVFDSFIRFINNAPAKPTSFSPLLLPTNNFPTLTPSTGPATSESEQAPASAPQQDTQPVRIQYVSTPAQTINTERLKAEITASVTADLRPDLFSYVRSLVANSVQEVSVPTPLEQPTIDLAAIKAEVYASISNRLSKQNDSGATALASTLAASLAAVTTGGTFTTPTLSGTTLSDVLGTMLKTDASGHITAAIAGTDYVSTTTGNWLGTIGGLSPAAIISGGFSTTSAAYFLTTKTTDNLTQGASNKYYATSLFNTDFAAKTTDGLTQGSTNKYYATSLFTTDFATKTTDNLTQGSTNKYYASSLFNTDLGTKTTDNLTQGSTNLYWSQTRFDNALSATTTLQNLTTLKGLTDFISTRSTTTNATSTSFFATTASSTNFFTSSLTVGADAAIHGIGFGIGAGTGSENTAVGGAALTQATTGSYNTAIGYATLNSNKVTIHNTAVGAEAMESSLFGGSSDNTAVGYQALFFGGGGRNTIQGVDALFNDGHGTNNAVIGYQALKNADSSSYNVVIGSQALLDVANSGTSNNVIIGYNSGRGITTGGSNTIIGANVTGLSSTLSNNIIIADGSGNQRINIDSSGYVGIGTTNPAYKLEVDTSGALGMSISTFSSTVGNPQFYVSDNNRNVQTGISSTDGVTTGTYIASYSNTPLMFATGAATAQMTMLTSGNVGIGVTNPSHKLQLSVDDAAKPTSNTWTIISDKRLKQNILSFNDGLNVLNQINPVSYELNGKAGTPYGAKGIGILAQDVKDIIPYTIGTFQAKLNPGDATNTTLYDFNSSALTFVLINGVKELSIAASSTNARIDVLEHRVTVLEAATSTGQVVTDSSGVLADLSYMGVQITQGIATFGDIIANKITAKHAVFDDMQLKDVDTGNPYCVRVKSGVLIQTAGTCESTASSFAPPASNGGGSLSSATTTDATSTPATGDTVTSTPSEATSTPSTP